MIEKNDGNPQARMDYENGFRTAQEGLKLPEGASESAIAGYAIGLSTGRTGLAGTSPLGGFKSGKRFFHALNSNRFVKSKSFQFSFSPYQHVGGMWMGTYATDDTEQIAALDELVAGGKSAVTPLTPEEYDHCQKKKAETLKGLGQSLIHSEAQLSPQSASPAAALNTEPPAPEPPAPPVESVDALALGESKMPEEPESAAT